MTAKTTNERQQAFKQRQQEAGLKEIRNLWAKPENHAKIVAYAKALETPTAQLIREAVETGRQMLVNRGM